MWFFLTRRLRTWLILAVLVPLTGRVLRRVGRTLERRYGPTRVSGALLTVADVGERTGRRLRGRRPR